MLPFEPESMESMKAKFDEATREVYDLDEVEKNPEMRPGNKRRHIFDFEDGMRMIVSKDRTDGKIVLHVSVSFIHGIELGVQGIVEEVTSRVVEVSGDRVPAGIVKVFVSDSGILHLLFVGESKTAIEFPMPSNN